MEKMEKYRKYQALPHIKFFKIVRPVWEGIGSADRRMGIGLL